MVVDGNGSMPVDAMTSPVTISIASALSAIAETARIAAAAKRADVMLAKGRDVRLRFMPCPFLFHMRQP
jgi:hypothetical protein